MTVGAARGRVHGHAVMWSSSWQQWCGLDGRFYSSGGGLASVRVSWPFSWSRRSRQGRQILTDDPGKVKDNHIGLAEKPADYSRLGVQWQKSGIS
jgi:hypothetical protein